MVPKAGDRVRLNPSFINAFKKFDKEITDDAFGWEEDGCFSIKKVEEYEDMLYVYFNDEESYVINKKGTIRGIDYL